MSEPSDSTAVAAPTGATPDAPTVGSKGPGWLPTTLVVVATCIAVISTLTTWVRAEALDTDEWVGISDELIADPEIRDALSLYLTGQLFSAVDVATELEELLPEQLAGLAVPLAGAIRGSVDEAVDRLLASERFAALWTSANRLTHERVVAVLRDETSPATSTTDGTVTLELGVIVRSLGESLGIPAGALDRIPPEAGQITIFESEQLANAQTAVQILDFLSWFLFVVVVALYALAVFLARGRRERMLFRVGIALAVGGVSVLVLRAVGVRGAVGAVVADANRSIGLIVGETATRLLQEIAWAGITFGLLIAVFAGLLTDHRWAVAVRRALSRFAASTGAAIAAMVAILLLLVWWSPGRAFDRWVTALTLIAMVIGAVAVLVTRVRSEFPAAAADDAAE